MTRLITILTLTALVLTAGPPAWAADKAALVPENARFSLVFNPSRVMHSRLGQTILDRVRLEEPNVDAMIDEFSETVGIDLRTALGRTILYGTGYRRGDFALVSDIGPTSGNINGLLLAAPGYQSSVYREKVIVHSLSSADDTGGPDRIYCAMPRNPRTGSFYLVASFDPKRTRDMIDQTLNGAGLTTTGTAEGTLIEAWFGGLPELARAAEADGPSSVVAELVRQAHFSLNESGDTVAGELTLTMADNLRAQQVFELMRGGLAMLQLAATTEPKVQPIADMGALIQVDHTPDDATVTARFNCSYDKLEQLLEVLNDM